MIKRPLTLMTLNVDMKFNSLQIDFLEIDLFHINKNERSGFSVFDVAEMVKRHLDGVREVATATKTFGKESCIYFARTVVEGKRNYRFILCICSDKPNTLGVMTLYRTR